MNYDHFWYIKELIIIRENIKCKKTVEYEPFKKNKVVNKKTVKM